MRRSFLIAFAGFMLLPPAVALAQPIERIDSRTDDPAVSLSAAGRFVAFASQASDLVPGDSNNDYDAFVYDRHTGALEMVSVASDGTQADAGVSGPVLSADRRYVAFASGATNLVAGDTNGCMDIFVHDRQTGVTQRVSVAGDGSETDFLSLDFSLSADGRYVAFASRATNLVTGDLNDHWDVFVRDRQAGTTEIVGLAADGSQGDDWSHSGCSLSADGRYVAFLLAAGNLAPGDGSLNSSAAAALGELNITSAVKVGTYVNLPAGVDGLANLSGANRYVTNKNVAVWGRAYGGLAFAHTALATGGKFPDALASGPYLTMDRGILLLSPLLGPLPETARDHHDEPARHQTILFRRDDRTGRRPSQGAPPVAPLGVKPAARFGVYLAVKRIALGGGEHRWSVSDLRWPPMGCLCEVLWSPD
jgi:hypothetical protein